MSAYLRRLHVALRDFNELPSAVNPIMTSASLTLLYISQKINTRTNTSFARETLHRRVIIMYALTINLKIIQNVNIVIDLDI